MTKKLRSELIKEIRNVEKNYHSDHVEVIDNLLKQVYEVIRTDINVRTDLDSRNNAKSLTNNQLSLQNEEDKL